LKPVDPESIVRMFAQGFGAAFRNSSLFFISALMLSRQSGWSRAIGSSVGSFWSLYLAVMSDFHPWANYFNVLANLLYLTAAYNNNPGVSVPTLREYQRLAQPNDLPPFL